MADSNTVSIRECDEQLQNSAELKQRVEPRDTHENKACWLRDFCGRFNSVNFTFFTLPSYHIHSLSAVCLYTSLSSAVRQRGKCDSAREHIVLLFCSGLYGGGEEKFAGKKVYLSKSRKSDNGRVERANRFLLASTFSNARQKRV